VTLTVTDSNNLTGTITQTVTVSAPPAPPVAAFTPSCPNLACTFDASASTDPSGATITGYAWTFGDGHTGSGQTASNTYPAAGDYTVTLTVTDSNNLTNTVTHVVSPRPAANPSIPLYASDNFNRTVSNGWGTAPTGGAWTPQGAGTSLAVANGIGSLTMSAPGAGPGVYLGGVSSTDSSTAATLTTNAAATGNGIYADIVGRRVSSSTDYRGRLLIKANNTVQIALIANNAGTATTIKAAYTLPGVTYAPGMVLNAQLVVTGTSPTTIGFKVWPVGTTQPTGWQISVTDSTAALQVPGAVGIVSFLTSNSTVAPVALQVSSFSSGPSAGLPTGAFTASCSGQQCATDASASTDPSGTISNYQWSWGDGTVTTGVKSQHTYAQAGTYRITLTVTDPSGWTAVVTRSVTVPA
jgi:PKD repeat protein